jgi:hypothetical protein
VEWEFQSHHIRVEFTPMMGIPPSDSRMASLELEVVSSITYFLD